ncbi:hypothetical protein COCNU_scaffold005031G000040 [Cocos nucifera]|nr:hypothetical protein [Cocos nucifera]
MDAKVVEMLAKELQAHKRKGKAPHKGLKKARIDIPSSMASVNAIATLEVADGIKVAPATEVGTIDGAAVPPTSSSPPIEIQVPKLNAKGKKREKEEEKKEVDHHKGAPSEEAGPSTTAADLPPAKPIVEKPGPTDAMPNSSIAPLKSPVEADPLPQGVPLKVHVKNLRKEVHQLKRKLGKMEGELQKFKKSYADANVEINRLHQVHKKDAIDYIDKKRQLTEELERAKKLSNDKAWVLSIKIFFLEAKSME